MSSPDVGKLRELAEDALDKKNQYDGDYYAPLVACGLLSVLDALEAANKEMDEHLAHLASEEDAYCHQRDLRKAAEASRDQVIKERDELAEALREIDDIETDGMTISVAADDPALPAAKQMQVIARAALAGVPGGSPEEEHNPGTTAAQSSVVGGDEA